jgi:hypothetical protein
MSMTDSREVVPGRYSVTEILKPLRQMYLSRRVENYIDPEKQIFLINGTAIHGVLEEGARKIKDKESHRVEEGFSVEIIPGFTLSGRPDYYDVKMKTLWDFKNSKAYTVKKIKRAAGERVAWHSEDYFAQLNIYRTFAYPDAEKLKLYFFVQGWTRRDELKPIEQIGVPLAQNETVKLWVRDRAKKILDIESGKLPLPKCATADLWIRQDGTPVRCDEYCPALSICDQRKEMKK